MDSVKVNHDSHITETYLTHVQKMQFVFQKSTHEISQYPNKSNHGHVCMYIYLLHLNMYSEYNVDAAKEGRQQLKFNEYILYGNAVYT